MKITIVTYTAFDKTFTTHFEDKSLDDIKDELFIICNTFDILNYKVYDATLIGGEILRVPILVTN